MSLSRAAQRLVESLLLAVLVAAWRFLTERSTTIYWPPPRSIVDALAPTWLHGRLTSDVLPSLLRLSVGYAVALLLGVSLGVLIGSLPRVRAVLEPVQEFFRAIPPPVLTPILILFLGIGDTMKVFVIVSGCIWPVLLNTAEGVRAVDLTLRDTARVYRLRFTTRLFRLVLPSAGPRIAAGARQALSIGLILMAISEMFAAQDGIGYAVTRFQRNFDIPEMWTGIIMLGLIGFALSIVFRRLERRMLQWYYAARSAERGAVR